MPRRYPVEVRRQVVEFARSGTNVAQSVATFGMSEATIYTWLRQQQIDRGEISGTRPISRSISRLRGEHPTRSRAEILANGDAEI